MNGTRTTRNTAITEQRAEPAQSAGSAPHLSASDTCPPGIAFSDLHSLRPDFDSLLRIRRDRGQNRAGIPLPVSGQSTHCA